MMLREAVDDAAFEGAGQLVNLLDNRTTVVVDGGMRRACDEIALGVSKDSVVSGAPVYAVLVAVAAADNAACCSIRCFEDGMSYELTSDVQKMAGFLIRSISGVELVAKIDGDVAGVGEGLAIGGATDRIEAVAIVCWNPARVRLERLPGAGWMMAASDDGRILRVARIITAVSRDFSRVRNNRLRVDDRARTAEVLDGVARVSFDLGQALCELVCQWPIADHAMRGDDGVELVLGLATRGQSVGEKSNA